MSLPYLLPALTVLVVVVLGIVAIVCSTSGGVEWLQARWKRPAAPSGDDSKNAPGRNHEGPTGR